LCTCELVSCEIESKSLRLCIDYNNVTIVTGNSVGDFPIRGLLEILTNTLFVHQINNDSLRNHLFKWVNHLGLGEYLFINESSELKTRFRDNYSERNLNLVPSETFVVMKSLPSLALSSMARIYKFNSHFTIILENCITFCQQFFCTLASTPMTDDVALYIVNSFLSRLFTETSLTAFGFIECLSSQNCLPFSKVHVDLALEYFKKFRHQRPVFQLIFKCILANSFLLKYCYPSKTESWFRNNLYNSCHPYGYMVLEDPDIRTKNLSIKSVSN